MAGIGPKKSLFKRRAAPIIVQKIVEPSTAPNLAATTTILAPTSLTGSTHDGGALTTDSDSSPPQPAANDPGIELFRRAKHFFPKTAEAPQRAGAKKVQNQQKAQASPIDHDPKRRKVSSEPEDSGIRSRGGSLGHDGHCRHKATSPVELRDSSASPSPPPHHDKGKGVAALHTVNAGVIITDAPDARTHESPSAEVDGDTPAEAKPKSDAETDAVDDSVIILDDSDSDNAIPKPKPQPRPRKDSWEEDVTGSAKKRGLRGLDSPAAANKDSDGAAEVIDPEFEEYIIRARAQEAASRAAREVQDINAQMAANARRSVSDDRADGSGGAHDAEHTFDSQATASSATTAGASDPLQPRPMNDQSYRIFITSRLPVAVPPLIANVRMDQELRHVKNAFLSHAHEKGCALPPDVAKSVLLTWKGAKIYDFTTGQTLNLNPDARGRFQRTDVLDNLSRVTDGGGGSHKVSAGFISGGLHIEIWTEELYDQYIADQEKQRRRNMGETLEEDLLSDDDEAPAGELAGPKREGSAGNQGLRQPSQQVPDKIRLVLTSRSYDKLSVTAHTDTTIATLIQAFRIQRGIAQDKPITIWMDGEQLAGDSTVGDADMEDLDSIEVHV